MIGNAKLNLTPSRGYVEIDGHRLGGGITRLSLDASALEIPCLQLNLRVHELEVDGEVRVTIPEETRDVLAALGWTPPAGDTAADLTVYRQGLLDQIGHLGDTYLAEQVRAELYRAENAEAKLADTEARLQAAVRSDA